MLRKILSLFLLVLTVVVLGLSHYIIYRTAKKDGFERGFISGYGIGLAVDDISNNNMSGTSQKL